MTDIQPRVIENVTIAFIAGVEQKQGGFDSNLGEQKNYIFIFSQEKKQVCTLEHNNNQLHAVSHTQ